MRSPRPAPDRGSPGPAPAYLSWALVAALVVLSCGEGAPASAPKAEPENAVPEAASIAWPESTPEAEGIDGAALAALDAELRAGQHGLVDSLLVVRHGRVVADFRYVNDYVAKSAGYDPTPHQYNYYHPDWHPFFKGSALHTLQSVTKSVTSVLIGIAIQRGEIPGVDAPGLALLGARTFADPGGRKAAIELADLLTMRAGIEWDESSLPYTDPGNDCARMEASTDWIQFVLDQPMAADPGEVWVYSSGVSQLLSGILRAATGATADQYAERHLFGPLGITEYHWKMTPDGLPDTEGGLYLRPEDLAKIGALFLAGGAWRGQRIVPESWVRDSIEPWVTDVQPANSTPDWGYGYQWWIREGVPGEGSRLFAARGYGGQFLFVIPSLDLVTVFTGWDIFEQPPSTTALFLERIVPAVRADTAPALGA